jgi:hypothetical protein
MGVVSYTKIFFLIGIFFGQCTNMVCVCDKISLVVEHIRMNNQHLTMGRVIREESCP